MSIKIERIISSFEEILPHSASKNGFQRFSYSDEDRKVREILELKLNKLGINAYTDSVGNMLAVYDPDNTGRAPLLIGSHIDTVANGGQFDGLTGVLASVEVLYSMHEKDIKPRIPVGLIVFAEEEGSNFRTTMVGSKLFSGSLTIDDLYHLKNDQNVSAIDLMQKAGYSPSEDDLLKISELKPVGMIELHVEQGGVLDRRDIPLGIVSSIVGMNTFEVTVSGQSNHAGTTPMEMRQDPLPAASKIIASVTDLPMQYGSHYAVATVGKVIVEPNSPNVIAREVRFTVDIRDVNTPGIEAMSLGLGRLVKEQCLKADISFELDLLGSSRPIEASKIFQQAIMKEADLLKIPYLSMPSGAVHYCAMLAGDIPIGMIFVPSKDGISHSEFEFTSYEDIEKGTEVLFQVVKSLTTDWRSRSN